MEQKRAFLNQDYIDEVLERVKDGIYITDGDANTIYLNHSYELISGLQGEEMIGRNMKDLVRDGIISESGSITAIKNKEIVTIEQSFKTGRRAVITSSPVYGDPASKKNIIMVITIVREITEIYSARKELQRLNGLNLKYTNEIEKLRRALYGGEEFLAEDAVSKDLLRFADVVSLIDHSVMITGERGTGKSRVARYIHDHSKRAKFPFMTVNFGMVSQEDPVKHIFGFDNKKTGKYELGILESAAGGTVYIDEISEMPESVRERFLSLLKDGQCIMGDGMIHKLDVRFIVSSRHSMAELQKNRLVPNEILQCLSAFPLKVPPLRERKKDVLPLVAYFLKLQNQKTGEKKFFSEDCFKLFLDYNWPDNVREVSQVVERAVILSIGDEIEPSHIMFGSKGKESNEPVLAADGSSIAFSLKDFSGDLKDEVAKLEAYYMAAAFAQYDNVRDAAKSLNMDSSTFVRKRQKYVQLGLM